MFTLVILLYFKVSQRMKRQQKSCTTLCTPSLAPITPLPANIFSNNLAPNVLSIALRNPPLSFLFNFKLPE